MRIDDKTGRMIKKIERMVNNEELTAEQRQTPVNFDRFNELEAGCSLGTRANYLEIATKLALFTCEEFDKITKEMMME